MCEYCEKKNSTEFCKSLIDEEYSHTYTKEPVRADVCINYWFNGSPYLNVDLVDHDDSVRLGDVTCLINFCPMCGRKLSEADDEQQG